MSTHRTVRITVLAVSLALILALGGGGFLCYAYLRSAGDWVIRGMVYEWVNAPAGVTGDIVFGNSAGTYSSEGKELVPLDATDTVIYFKTWGRHEFSDMFRSKNPPSGFNSFSVSGYGSPSMIKVEKPGYYAITKKVSSGSSWNMVILLVRDKSIP